MKYLLIILAIIFINISCEKQTQNPSPKEPETLTGKWNYSQRFYSSGGPLIYESTKNLKQWIVFGTNDGAFSSNLPDFKNVTSYEIVDSIKVKLNLPSQDPDSRLFFYKILPRMHYHYLPPILFVLKVADIFLSDNQ